MINFTLLNLRVKRVTRNMLFLLCVMLLGYKSSEGQVYTESFNLSGPYPQTMLPFGWTQSPHCFDATNNPTGGATCNDPDNYWDIVGPNSRIGNPATPTCSPRSGGAMLRYRSDSIAAGEKAIVVSKRLDMTAIPVGGAAGSLWMYRENVTTNLDSINIYANITPNMSGSPVRITATANFPRYCGAAPVTACFAPYNPSGWYQINFTIPGTGMFVGSNSVYVIITGCGRGTTNARNIFIDDFSVMTYPNPEQLFASAAVVNQNTTTTAPGLLDQQIIGLYVSTQGQGPGVGIRDLIFNTNGSTNPVGDIVLAKLWFTGGTNDFDPATAQLLDTYNAPHATNFTMLTTAFTGMANGDNYFWLTYEINGTANLGNYVDAEVVSFNSIRGITPFTVTARAATPATLTGSRLINISYCGANNILSWPTKRDFIRQVVLAGDVLPGINNMYNTYGPAGCSPCQYTPTPPAYDFFPPTVGRTASLTPGNPYSISVTVGPGGGLLGIFGFTGGSIVSAWIDYDKDGGFQASERLGISGWLGSNATATFNFTVPAAALAGNARLRVRTSWILTPTSCGTGLFGETEDYIVAMIPPCAPLWPGWKTWLGFTNDWDNPVNWCGGIPTLADNARIPGPGGANGRPGAFSPKIKAGVIATAKNLRIESNDTIFVNAAKNASLTVDSTLLLLNNTSALIVNSTFSDSAQVSNGTLTVPFVNASYSPLKGNTPKVRNFWLFTQDDLLAKGLLAGDVVTNLLLHVKRQATNAVPFKNLVIKIYYTDGTVPGFRFNGALAAPAPAYQNMPPVIGPAPVTVFGPQDVSVSAFIPVSNNYGTIDFSLIPGAFVWNGTTNKLVVDMSYDNQGFAVPNNNDIPNFTQTLGLQHFMSVIGNKDNANYPGGNMVVPFSALPAANVNGNITGVAGTNTIASSYLYASFAVGQWVGGTGVSVSTTVAVAAAAGSPTFTVASGLNIQIGHYVQGGSVSNGPIVTNVAGNVITINPPLIAALAAGAGMTFRPAITALSSTTPPYAAITLSANLTAAPAGNISFGSTNSTPSLGTEYRPNLTFKFDRPYETFPITVKRDWVNNGLFVPAKSRVTFATSLWGGGQQISGTNISTFYDLAINDIGHVSMNLDAIVTDSLVFNAGHLKINNNLLTVTNGDPGAMSRTGGGLQADADVLGAAVAPFSRVRWDMGSVAGNRIVPFVNVAGDYIPLEYNTTAGTHDVTFTTYATPPDNQNIPLPVVTNILGQIAPGVWGTTGFGMVDRYYMIDNTAGSGGPVADLTFRYANSEQAGYGNSNMRAQRWLSATSVWELPLIAGQVHTPGTPDAVSLSGFNQFSASNWWTIVGQTTPLPVTLLNFTATPFKDRVRLDWVTGSEINSSHFIVERTINNMDFSYIGRVESRGPTTNNTEYQTWDLNPAEGIQYYYLRQYDRDGRSESFGPVSAKFSKNLFDIVTAIVANNEMGLTVVFNYDSNKPFSYRIIDMAGRIIAAKDRNPGIPGVNSIEIDTKLAKGVYQVILQNDDKVVSRKFFN